ncbi:hypothetical protein BWQ96_07371 [Gracilariopsis chorda]|uniref:Uncharacterized protein n=1 Tax=Gracilariopsis chorda TaxID=448386 RepID=A0A2V3ILF6_9FLOR|nr:hypothetical protein BWQ96_07371 [Gracilariopsis chorda]|eukprot:PXF42924.1 hypothetical protein BWQ96_07371 [Gracilariopsis chorda]
MRLQSASCGAGAFGGTQCERRTLLQVEQESCSDMMACGLWAEISLSEWSSKPVRAVEKAGSCRSVKLQLE